MPEEAFCGEGGGGLPPGTSWFPRYVGIAATAAQALFMRIPGATTVVNQLTNLDAGNRLGAQRVLLLAQSLGLGNIREFGQRVVVNGIVRDIDILTTEGEAIEVGGIGKLAHIPEFQAELEALVAAANARGLTLYFYYDPNGPADELGLLITVANQYIPIDRILQIPQ